ncbi:MAG: helix-turn-helix domain-containing protein, partial [Tunicatimonas sp.]|uniref:helix-turn-helix domain-containing protein n=1 Tax=Tunicatimonas sp. TaxID=1940096 RepID=UPI003C78DFD8
INQYCTENDLDSRMTQVRRKSRKKRSSQAKSDTKQRTYDYYRQGKSVAEIAQLRELSPTTVSTHLAHFVQNGSLDVTELVDPATITKIEDAVYVHGDSAMKPLKDALDDSISYDEIRLVVAYNRR